MNLRFTCVALSCLLAGVLGLASFGDEGRGIGNSRPRQIKLEPFPVAVAHAWRAVGAFPGWMSAREDGTSVFRQGLGTGKPGEWPAFRLREWKRGRIMKLPAPDKPFALDLRWSGVSDADLWELAAFTQLRGLNVQGCHVTEAGLNDLARFKRLHFLIGVDLTDVGLKRLTTFPELQTLSHFGSRFTDAGLKELKDLKWLRTLRLGSTEVTAVGLKELKGLRSLTSLDLSHRLITETDLQELKQLKGLQWQDSATQVKRRFMIRTRLGQRRAHTTRRAADLTPIKWTLLFCD